MKQRKENSNDTTRPNWHFFFFTPRVFLESCSRYALRVYCKHVLPLWRDAKSEKRDIRSLSRKRRARSRCLSFSFLFFSSAPPLTSLGDPRGCANVTIIQFYRFKYSAKGLKDSTVLLRDFQARINSLDSESTSLLKKLKTINTWMRKHFLLGRITISFKSIYKVYGVQNW